MKVHIHKGSNAWTLLNNPQFQRDWDSLYQQCTWATGFQSPHYASVWYKIYRQQFEPIIFTNYNAENRLSGLFTLAFSPKEKRLLGAGDRQAEYHAWLTSPNQDDTFILEVIKQLDQIYPGVPLVLKYLPPNAPVGWLEKDQAEVFRRCELETFKRNFLRLDDKSKVEAYVRSKKRLKTKMNKLKRTGQVCFQRITNEKVFEMTLNEIIPLFDFRQGAVNGATPFRSNPLKKAFFLALFKESNLHVTVLTLEGRVISALMSIYGHGVFPLGEIVHSAFMHKFSPGALHLLMTVQLLTAEGFKEFDLTPGGDVYKDRMASGSDTVYALTVHQNRKQHITSRTNKQIKAIGQNILSRLPNKGARLKRIISATHSPVMLRQNIIPKNFLQLGRKSAVYHIYSLASTQVKDQSHSVRISKNKIADLLLFKPSAGGQSAWLAFLSDSWKRIHKGAHLYTSTENNSLIQLVWVLEKTNKIIPPETHKTIKLPEEAACLSDFYSNGYQSDNIEACSCFLNAVMTDVFKNNIDINKCYLGASEQDTTFRDIIEQLGCILENIEEQEETTS